MPLSSSPERPDREAVGLCFDCQHARRVAGARSTFFMCERARTDPRYPRYPPLPVRRCPGYEQKPAPDVI